MTTYARQVRTYPHCRSDFSCEKVPALVLQTFTRCLRHLVIPFLRDSSLAHLPA